MKNEIIEQSSFLELLEKKPRIKNTLVKGYNMTMRRFSNGNLVFTWDVKKLAEAKYFNEIAPFLISHWYIFLRKEWVIIHEDDISITMSDYESAWKIIYQNKVKVEEQVKKSTQEIEHVITEDKDVISEVDEDVGRWMTSIRNYLDSLDKINWNFYSEILESENWRHCSWTLSLWRRNLFEANRERDIQYWRIDNTNPINFIINGDEMIFLMNTKLYNQKTDFSYLDQTNRLQRCKFWFRIPRERIDSFKENLEHRKFAAAFLKTLFEFSKDNYNFSSSQEYVEPVKLFDHTFWEWTPNVYII